MVVPSTFVPHSPIADLFNKPRSSSSNLRPPSGGNERIVQVPAARSLDSYRSGARFDDRRRKGANPQSPLPSLQESRPAQNQPSEAKSHERPAKKSTMTLVRALVSLNVASTETCAFLIRCGCVRINGAVETDEKARVHRQVDRLMVNGKDIGTVDSGANFIDEKEQRSPRAHRDRSPIEIEALTRSFQRRTDDGFFASKKRKANR